MPTRTRALARRFPYSVLMSLRLCRPWRDAILVEQTRKYLRHPVRAGISAPPCVAESSSNVPRRPTHNKRMRITNATVRYRVSGDNYIGRKNDTELRAIRWQREITPAMHFFSLLQGRNYRAKLLTRQGASWTPRSGTELTRLFRFSCLLIIIASFFSYWSSLSHLKEYFYFNFSYLIIYINKSFFFLSLSLKLARSPSIKLKEYTKSRRYNLESLYFWAAWL